MTSVGSPLSDPRARWMRELERLSLYKTQFYLHGNINDIVLYPLRTQSTWTLGPLRAALFEFFKGPQTGYEIVGAYSPIEGMCFADAQEKNEMARLFDEVVQRSDKNRPPRDPGRAAQALQADDPLYHALHQIHCCMINQQRPTVFILEQASQLLAAPTHLSLNERLGFLRILKDACESQLVRIGEPPNTRTVQNLLILVCDKLTDLPAWLYLNNPFCGNISIEEPRSNERKHFFERFLVQTRPDGENSAPLWKIDDLVDLTDGMSFRDLMGIRSLARRGESQTLSTKSLVDCYKYGARESEWDSLSWDRLAEENAEAKLGARVIGQPAAVAAVADVLRRARLNLSGAQHSGRGKPRGVLFFAGPTGVGKTELAKAVAELVFKSEEACIRFDMSEYSQAHADQRLLGAPPGYIGYEEGGQLTNRVKSNPFSVLLFDEIDKAHPSILDKFLQILEDGRMTDGRGETVYFSECILIFTSNAGIYKLDPFTGRPATDPETGQPELLVDPARLSEYHEVKAEVLKGVQSFFKHHLGRPELLNRIGDNIIVFDFIRPEVMREILETKILPSIQEQIQQKCQLDVLFAPAVTEDLMQLARNQTELGGRGIGNLAEAALLNPLARTIYRDKVTNEPIKRTTLRVLRVVPPGSEKEHRYDIEIDCEPGA